MFVSVKMISMSSHPTPSGSRDDHRCGMACWVIVILPHTETNLCCLRCTLPPSSTVCYPMQFLAARYCGSIARNSTSPYTVALDSAWFCKLDRLTVLTALRTVTTMSKFAIQTREQVDGSLYLPLSYKNEIVGVCVCVRVLHENRWTYLHQAWHACSTNSLRKFRNVGSPRRRTAGTLLVCNETQTIWRWQGYPERRSLITSLNLTIFDRLGHLKRFILLLVKHFKL